MYSSLLGSTSPFPNPWAKMCTRHQYFGEGVGVYSWLQVLSPMDARTRRWSFRGALTVLRCSRAIMDLFKRVVEVYYCFKTRVCKHVSLKRTKTINRENAFLPFTSPDFHYSCTCYDTLWGVSGVRSWYNLLQSWRSTTITLRYIHTSLTRPSMHHMLFGYISSPGCSSLCVLLVSLVQGSGSFVVSQFLFCSSLFLIIHMLSLLPFDRLLSFRLLKHNLIREAARWWRELVQRCSLILSLVGFGWMWIFDGSSVGWLAF